MAGLSLFAVISGGSKGGNAGDTCSPAGVQILSISCSFWEILAKSYVGVPPRELASPPRGNPGSTTGNDKCFRKKLPMSFLFNLVPLQF